MPSPRIRRLTQDYEVLRRLAAASPLIELTGTAGLPPEIYRFSYKLKGLYVSPAGEILERDAHLLQVNLTLDYPRRAPQCRLLTPIFHPNFDETSVCIGDFWAASEGLDDLVIRIGRMIAYQEFNTKSPLNGLAAKWAAEHPQLLPVDAREVSPTGDALSSAPLAAGPGSADGNSSEPPSASEVQSAALPPRAEPEDPWSDKIVIS